MKKMWILAVAVLGMVASGLQGQDFPASGREIDRLLAAVNGKVITESDLTTARTLTALLDLGRSPAPQSRQQDLDRLIDQELIRQEMENFPIGQEDRSTIEKQVQDQMENLRNAYAEIGGLPALLRQLGLREEELVSHMRQIALTLQFMDLRFRPFLAPSGAEDLEEKLNLAMDQWIENIRKQSRIEFFSGASGLPAGEDK
jgi:hypothetical protein